MPVWRSPRPPARPTSSETTWNSVARRQSSSSTTWTSSPRRRASRVPASSTPARTARPRRGCWCRSASPPTSRPRCAEAARATRVGGPDDTEAYFGPVNNHDQLDRVQGFLSRAPDHAEVVTGGGRIGDRGYFLQPTVVSGLRQADEMVQEEVFGPVITVQSFGSRGRGFAVGKRPSATGWRPASGRGIMAEPCGCRDGWTSGRCGSTHTSHSSQKCRMAALVTQETARTCLSMGLRNIPTQARHELLRPSGG